ncbi:hypothetical protein D9758_015727 [Tetrapyrgos nigripes]|uniref:Uncharacterized protein n=1 Tax=Tetrapyrgos nigripes TaxID=182062 RepID=A0A8H5FRT8_9AGAR|nr:hypothetical protein D9758_015727 [Tetrapyrgos nigripes]
MVTPEGGGLYTQTIAGTVHANRIHWKATICCAVACRMGSSLWWTDWIPLLDLLNLYRHV